MVAKRILEFFVGCLYMLEFERIGAYWECVFLFCSLGASFMEFCNHRAGAVMVID